MYFKNTSRTTSVVLNTVRGKVGIKPQEVVDIKYKVLPPISQALQQVSEDEYLTFCEARDGVMPTAVQVEAKSVRENTPVVNEAPVGIPKDDKQETSTSSAEETVTEIKDKNVMGFINDLLTQKPKGIQNLEEPVTEDNANDSEALLVTETTTETEAERLTKQIETLKKAWSDTAAPRKKEKIAKEIKELQKQLKKLQA